MGLQENAALKEKLYIRLGRTAFVLRYEQWQLHEAARAASSQPAAQHADNRELWSKEEDESRDYCAIATCEYPTHGRKLSASTFTVNNDELISAAESVLLPRTVKGRLFGDVGAAVLSSSGRLFFGVSVDTPSWGLCAERCALATMIAAGEYGFQKGVAVWIDPATHLLFILPPCGVCREFMRSIDDENLDS